TLQALRGRINARLQTSAISRDRARAAGREVVAQCRQSDVETLEWVLSEIDAILATPEPSGEAGRDSTDCPTCGDELAVYWEEGRIRGVVSLDQPARAALHSEAQGELDQLRELICDVAASGVVVDDARLRYVEIQVDRQTWDEVRTLAAARRGEGGFSR